MRPAAAFFFALALALPARAEVPPPDAPDLPHLKAACLANGCSATIISKGPGWACGVTAAHCFSKLQPGGKFPVKFQDGAQTEGVLLSIDRDSDQVRFAVPSRFVLGVAPVALGAHDRARYEAVGFPGRDPSRRPWYFLMAPASPAVTALHGEQFSRPTHRWAFKVDNGGATPGVSGTGVMANGQLVGILSNNNGHHVATCCYTSTPQQLVDFLRRSDAAGCDKWNMGEWGAPACRFADAPPAIAYADRSNHPLIESPGSQGGCRNGRCPLKAPAPAPVGPVAPDDPVPPPPDAGHGPGPQEKPQEHFAGGYPDGSIYDGHGRPPKDLRGRRKLAHEVDKLRHEEHGPGPQGPPGKDGRDGQDLRPEPIQRREGNFLPLILVCVAGVLVGKIVGYRRGY